jgi:hypothetical protein
MFTRDGSTVALRVVHVDIDECLWETQAFAHEAPCAFVRF